MADIFTVNPSAVSDIEAQRAREMLAANGVKMSPGHYLRALVKILIAGILSSFLVYRHIDTLASRVRKEFALHLETLRLEGQWLRVYAAASWLANISGRSVEYSPEDLGPERLFDNAFPTWRVWAAWRPDVERLRKWNELSTQNHVAPRDILALEGPDFFTCGATLKERALARGFGLPTSIVRIGNVQFVLSRGVLNEVQIMLDNLFQAIDIASRAGPNDIEFWHTSTLESQSLTIR